MKLSKLIYFFILIILIPVFLVEGQVYVRGYYRKDGVYVRPHYRTYPDGIPYNNYSFPGNYNPNTGKITPGDPLKYLEKYNTNFEILSTPLKYSEEYNTNLLKEHKKLEEYYSDLFKNTNLLKEYEKLEKYYSDLSKKYYSNVTKPKKHYSSKTKSKKLIKSKEVRSELPSKMREIKFIAPEGEVSVDLLDLLRFQKEGRKKLFIEFPEKIYEISLDELISRISPEILEEVISKISNQKDFLIIDGDTFEYNGERFRIYGYDAPELDEPGGLKAKMLLNLILLNGKNITIKRIKKDKYGRTIAKVFVDGIDIVKLLR